jgi:CyaY protein
MSTSPLTDTEYHAAADRVLAAIERQADAWLQDGVIDIDTVRTGGLLELVFQDGSKLVVNKQPPLHEMWLAARSGGFHFHWRAGDWVTNDGQELFARLSEEVSVQAGRPLEWPRDAAFGARPRPGQCEAPLAAGESLNRSRMLFFSSSLLCSGDLSSRPRPLTPEVGPNSS